MILRNGGVTWLFLTANVDIITKRVSTVKIMVAMLAQREFWLDLSS
jgi:hypothetical protein